MPNSDSRARFLAKLLLVLLPFLLAGAWLELRLRALPTSYSQKDAGFKRMAPDLDTLVLGASEAAEGVDAGALGPHAYNLANVGQSLYCDRGLFAWALPQAPKLKRVLWGVSFQSLGYHLEGTAEAWRSVSYFREFGILPEEGLRGLDFRFASAVLFYEPFSALRWALTGQGLGAPTLTATGQDPLPCYSDDDLLDIKINPRTAAQRAATHEGLTHMDAVDANLGEIKALKRLADARGVSVALFFLPVTKDYAQAINGDQRKLMVGRLKSLAAEQGMELKDYFQDPRFGDGDFFDVDHLCSRGSEKFSAILAKDFGSSQN
ncbi:MAG TPA: hypothetical protein VK786_05695 [bacterium]|jgi:hypothetical protein|nr:hypothetical protein [bacterium]